MTLTGKKILAYRGKILRIASFITSGQKIGYFHRRQWIQVESRMWRAKSVMRLLKLKVIDPINHIKCAYSLFQLAEYCKTFPHWAFSFNHNRQFHSKSLHFLGKRCDAAELSWRLGYPVWPLENRVKIFRNLGGAAERESSSEVVRCICQRWDCISSWNFCLTLQ